MCSVPRGTRAETTAQRLSRRKAAVRQRHGRLSSLPTYSRPQHAPARIARLVAQLLLDADQLVVLGEPVGARQRAGLDLAGVGGDRDVGDGGVLGLAGAVRDDGRVGRRAAPWRRRPASPSASRSG